MFENDVKNLDIITVLDISRSPTTGVARPRDFHSISFRLRGDSVFSYGEEKIHVGGGDLIFIPRGLGYTQVSNEEKLYCVHFSADGIPDDKILKFTPQSPKAFELLFSSLCQKWLHKKEGYRMSATSDMYAVIAKIQTEQSSSAARQPNYKNDIAEYIHTHYTDSELTVAKMAESFNLSESYFRKLFVHCFGVSPLKYINTLRVEYATDLISSGYYRINEAAQMSGFRDAKYFSTAVKEKTGKRPSDFKK